MYNKAFNDALSWAFHIFFKLLPFITIPILFTTSVRMFKILCGISGRGRRFSYAEKIKVVQDHLPTSSEHVVSGCADCPCLLKGDSCKLRGTGSCFIGQSVKKAGDKNADS